VKKTAFVFVLCLSALLLIGCNTEKDITERTATINGSTYSDYEGVGISIENITLDKENTQIEIKWKNDTKYNVIYGEYYIIEHEINGEWKICETPDNGYGFLGIGYILEPGTLNKTYNTYKMFDLSKPGKYRISTDCHIETTHENRENCNVWAEFIIE